MTRSQTALPKVPCRMCFSPIMIVLLVPSVIELIPTFGLRSYAMAGAIVLGTSAIAAWLPGRRAARIDPAAALRAE